ncbi:MAG: hypothetical protein KDA75_15270 [Planctomycetaceae bacterium]|nr:hypothetical protein [Planctomycetaceae bacterium]
MSSPDFKFLWNQLTDQFRLGPKSVHGPDHWRRVEANGIRLAQSTSGADLLVVRLFAVFHDAERWDDGSDLDHGPRAARLVQRVHRDWFEVSANQLELLTVACRDHTEGDTAADPTIGCCWDADRLDLPRVGIMPHRDFMSTALGQRLASGFR